ncbi:MAG: hypothetical protein HOC71_09210 [Candidatus Latescibacteria bacterium]|jgi:hypothetical protein|nr:hypothetical protein [Candidatus Latescibacterota bacterium]
MLNDDYLESLEKKIYRATYCDGLIDIFCGFMFIIAGAIYALENIGVSRFITVALLVPPIALLHAGRKLITNPRLGIVRLGDKHLKRKKNMRYVYWIVAITTTTLLILAVSGAYHHVWTGYFKSTALGAYILLTLGLTAYFIDFRRLYILALLGGAGMMLYDFMGRQIGHVLSAGLLFCVPGLAFAVYGFVLLRRFIREYPPLEESKGEA